MAKKDQADTPVEPREQKATPQAPGDPREAVAVDQLGGTFAERAKARKTVGKRVSKDDDVEDKAVKKASTKKKS